MTDFPTYESHLFVYCFQCGQRIFSDSVETAYPEGRGHWMKLCPCGFHTFYDIAPGGKK